MTAGGMDYTANDEMSLGDYWALARRRKWYIIVPVLFALGYSLATSMATTPMYRAKADVLVQAAPVPGAVSSETAMTARTLNNELLRAQGSALQAAARESVGTEPTMSVDLAQDKDADLFVFTAESRSAARAAEAANAYADTYVASRQADLAADFQSQADVLQQQLDDAETRLAESSEGAGAEELRVIIAGYRADIDEVQTAAKLAEESGATVVNIAEAPDGPFAPQPVRSAILAIFLGLFVGVAAALLRDFTDNHIRTPEALERATGLSTAAVVPRLKSWKKSETHVVILEDSSSPQAEAYRSLRARIQFRRVDRQIRSLMVTSARPGEGKTTTSSNLAVAFAAAGENTVLVDLDMRRPRIHKFFSLSAEHGMSTVLLGGELDSAIQPLSSVPNLSVVAAGPSTGESSEILHDEALEIVLGELKDRFDVVVIDTPPVLAVADPLTISHYCDGVLLVVSASGTDKRDAELAAGQLAGVGAPTVGAVLNNYSATQTGYSYSYAYSDYKSTSDSLGASGDQVADLSPHSSPYVPKLTRRDRRRLEKSGFSVDSETVGPHEVEPGEELDTSRAVGSDPVPDSPPLVDGALPSRAFEADTLDFDAADQVQVWLPSDQPSPVTIIAEETKLRNADVPDSDRRQSSSTLDEVDYLSDSAPGPDVSEHVVELATEQDVTSSDGEKPTEQDLRNYLRAELRQARAEHSPPTNEVGGGSTVTEQVEISSEGEVAAGPGGMPPPR